MIKEITFNNFKGKLGKYEFNKSVRIEGINGAGKTTIKDAVCFALMGTDSFGKKLPVHLISEGQTKMEVTLTTEKVKISRTLTSKKSATLSMLRKGAEKADPVTQEQLHTWIAPMDAFLTLFVPGYFQTQLNATRRKELLTSLLPKQSKIALLTELSGLDTSTLNKDIDNKPINKIKEVFTNYRRELQQSRDQASGRISVYVETLKSKTEVDPIKHPEIDKYAQMKLDYETWIKHEVEVKNCQQKNVATEQQVRLVKEQLEQLSKDFPLKAEELKVSEQKRKELEALVEALKQESIALDGEREFVNDAIINGECPTCSKKLTVDEMAHVEICIEKNKQIDLKKEAVIRQFKEVNVKIMLLNASIATLSAEHNDILVRITKLESFTPEFVAVQEPICAKVTKEDLDRLEIVANKYNNDLATYQTYKEQSDNAMKNLKDAKEHKEFCEKKIEVFAKLEEACDKIPAYEASKQEELLKMEGYKIIVDQDVSVVDSSGRDIMTKSYGESMKGMIAFSRKIDSLLSRPLNMVFIDNAESIDNIDNFINDSVQVFAAYVDAEAYALKVEELIK